VHASALLCAAVPGAGDGSNVVGRESGHPDSHETWVTVERLQQGLCGVSRPHFFRGVATVSCLAAASAFTATSQLTNCLNLGRSI
jgi:hypothetical protein